MSGNENKREKGAQIHASGIVSELECRFCIVILNVAKMNLNDKMNISVLGNQIERLKFKKLFWWKWPGKRVLHSSANYSAYQKSLHFWKVSWD